LSGVPQPSGPAAVSPSYSGSGVGGGYAPADLRSAYNLPSASAGSGQTVAIVDAYDDPNAESDLATYRSRYGFSACTTANACFRKVNQSGGTTYPSPNAGWAVEISLDLDMVAAACPNCHILLVEASSNSYSNLFTAEEEAATLGATEISNSWGGEEFSEETSYDSYFHHAGVPITVSAGDSGYEVEYPAASQYVIAVGGTRLTQASNLRGWSETAWSGTGSGCSAYEPKPAWQTDTGCANRTNTDVAAVASPETPVSVADSYKLPREFSKPEPGWTLVAGTSVSSPLVAGTMALANAYTRSFGGADALYREAAQNGTGVLDDVVSGSNGSCGNYLCNAGPGYDGPTGLGSPYGAPVVLPNAPAVETKAASSVTQTTATLNATVNPNGGEVSKCELEYGTSKAYGASAPCTPAPGSGESPVAVSASLTGLAANTEYHFRISATNPGGTSKGSDLTFNTSAASVSGGTWVGTVGHEGYDLAGWGVSSDVAELPAGASLSLTQGSRYVWAPSSSEARALQSPDGLTREAAGYYDSKEVKLGLTFTSAYTGNLRLYALDWDTTARRETITVAGKATTLSSEFHGGTWVTVPISVAAGETVPISATRTAGANAVISGIFLGDAGAPPTLASPSAPQGAWAGAFGHEGYDLAGWDGSSDVSNLPAGANLSLTQGSRYQWSASSSDARALQSPEGPTRKVAAYYDHNQIRLSLKFTSAYTGNLRLYALDWDTTVRRELVSAAGQTATLSGSFNAGAWVTVPIKAAAGETVPIVVDRTAGANAVLSGIFLE
jgi:hypothetical protein